LYDAAYYPAGTRVGPTDASQGKHIPTDTSGVIELSEAEAAVMVHGQIAPLGSAGSYRGPSEAEGPALPPRVKVAAAAEAAAKQE